MRRIKNKTKFDIRLPSLHVVPAGGHIDISEAAAAGDNGPTLKTLEFAGDIEIVAAEETKPAKAAAVAQPAKG